MTKLDPKELRRAFGAFMTGVTVVTTRDREGTPLGFTANSFSSVSLDPPLLLVCPGRFLNCFEAFRTCEHFAVSILAEGQEEVSNVFARFQGDRFAEVGWTSNAQGVPLIESAAAHFSCRTDRAIEAGDHVVLLGEVLDARVSGDLGLGYAGGRYFSLGLEREAARGGLAGAIVEYQGGVLLEETPEGLRPPSISLSDRAQVREAISGKFAEAGLEVTLGPAYAIYDERGSGRNNVYFLARAEGPETGGLGVYHPIDTLASARIADRACATMLRRFAEEYRTRNFGLYIGDDRSGEVNAPAQRS